MLDHFQVDPSIRPLYFLQFSRDPYFECFQPCKVRSLWPCFRFI